MFSSAAQIFGLLFALCCSSPAVAQIAGAETAPPPAQQVKLGIDAVMRHYNANRGLWQTEDWWNAANTTTILGEVAATDGSRQYKRTLKNTFARAQQRFALFRNEYYDDEGWWALAWIQAYDATHRKEYLKMAESIFADMSGGWDDTCGGGIWWKKDRHYKNAIANELFLSVAAHLAAREKGDQRGASLAWANREWKWFDQSGMINADNLVNDGLTPECQNNGRTTWTYNQGVLIGGLVELSRVTGDAGPRGEAGVIARASIAKLTDSDKVLHDRTEPNCSPDTVQFKGIFVRNLGALQKAAPDQGYVTFIHANANALWKDARTPENEFACRWSGPAKADGAAAATSALDTLIVSAGLP